MARKRVVGKCHICGKEGKLTFEHIPPGATYNKQSVRMVKLMDLLKAESEEDILYASFDNKIVHYLLITWRCTMMYFRSESSSLIMMR